MKTEIAARSKATLTREDYFPTPLQRATLYEAMAELMAILRRQVDAGGFVIADIPAWTRRLHGWPEVAGDTKQREKFVRELVTALVQFGAIRGDEKLLDGQRVRGYFVAPRRTAEHRHRYDPGKFNLTAADSRFLHELGISTGVDAPAAR
jgi:hypothetical protein